MKNHWHPDDTHYDAPTSQWCRQVMLRPNKKGPSGPGLIGLLNTGKGVDYVVRRDLPE